MEEDAVSTYTLGGMGDSGLRESLRLLDPDRDNGPNENLHIDFDNGVTLSLVWGRAAYASADTVEVAVFGNDDNNDWLTEAVAKVAFGEDIDDMVDGYCDADRVHGYFLAAQSWTERETP
jgi:hypothetical protein